MTVGELKEHLENYDDEMVVYVGYDYGDETVEGVVLT